MDVIAAKKPQMLKTVEVHLRRNSLRTRQEPQMQVKTAVVKQSQKLKDIIAEQSAQKMKIAEVKSVSANQSQNKLVKTKKELNPFVDECCTCATFFIRRYLHFEKELDNNFGT